MSETQGTGPARARLRRVLSIAGNSAMLIVCLALLVNWTARLVQHVGRWIHEPAVPAYGSVDVVYFYEPGCPACMLARPICDRLQRRYPQYRWARVDLSYPRGMELAETYYLHGKIPVRSRGTIPTVFVGTRAFIGYGEISGRLPAFVASLPARSTEREARSGRTAGRRATSGASRFALRAPCRERSERQAPRTTGAASIQERFTSFRVAPVLLAGLVDSVNPCAIATLIFFLSYLAFTGRRSRELLGVGAAFTVGVFLTYFLIGLGLLRLLHLFPITTTLARWVYPTTGLATLILAGISFRDGLKARRGQTAAMTLQLPKPLKRLTHRAIRTQMGARGPMSAGRLAGAAFASAVAVSALEFTCTSQVYLPTLMYMTQVEGHRLRATWLLVLYNLMFVAPLVVLFLLSALGANSRSVGAFFARKTAITKLAMSFLFASLSLYMFTVSARMIVVR
jgi:cytochrome c biogenesis protein CcdA